MDASQFADEVVARLVAEHGIAKSSFEYLLPKIAIAFDTEYAITADQLNELIHGDGDAGVPEELQVLFPLLNAIALSPYTDIDDEKDEKEAEEDDSDDDDDEEDEEEDEED